MLNKDLSIKFCGVKCENPFFLASAPIASNYEMVARSFDAGWGGAVFKTVGFFIPDEVSPRFDQVKMEGTPFVGFKNLEQISEYPLEQNLAAMRKLKEDYPNKVLVASIMAEKEEEWTELAKMVTEAGADIIECNFSCPQMTSDKMGADVGQNPDLVRSYTSAVRKGTHLPVLAKMTPNLGNMVVPAMAAMEGGATGLAAINTIKSLTSINLDNYVSAPEVNGKSAVSGYSGKAVKPIALRFIHELSSYPKLKGTPISGIGGIETWEDALEFILLGSGNIQVGTAVMQYGYRIVEDMISGLSYYMEEKGIDRLSDLIGSALKNIVPADSLDRDFIVLPEISGDKCIGCGRCYISCSDGGHQAIDWNKGRRPSINEDKCVGCHLCSLVCPAQAIGYGTIKSKVK